MHLAGDLVHEHWIESYYFEGDPVLNEGDARRAAEAGALLSLKQGSDRVLRGTRDIRLDMDLAERNRLVDGWYRNGEEP